MQQHAPFETRGLNTKPLSAVAGLERWDKTTAGRWQCELTVLTPLCVKSAFEQQYKDRAKLAVIPGSSLRGMVRNTAEILGAGCGRFYKGGRELPSGLSPCKESAVCVTCRVFGFVEGKTTWQSRVRFTDAVSQGDPRWKNLHVEVGSRGGTGAAASAPGWAVFEHKEETHVDGRVPCVGRSVKFRFGVEFVGFDATDYAVFRLALTLQAGEHHLVHKLGFAKSLGFGSCRVEVLNEAAIKDATRREGVAAETDRYAAMGGFQELIEWRTEER